MYEQKREDSYKETPVPARKCRFWRFLIRGFFTAPFMDRLLSGKLIAASVCKLKLTF